MASRFWVGGTGNWDAATTTHWSATSGGGGGASVPGSGDTVTLDASSGGGTVTITTTVNVISITMGAFTGTLDGNGQNVTLQTFNCSGTGTRTLTMGNGTWTITGNNGTVWTTNTTTNLTFNRGNAVVLNYSGSVGTRTVQNGTLAEGSAPSFNVTAGTDTVSISGTVFNYDLTGFAGPLGGANVTVFGDLTFGSGMTVNIAQTITLAATSGTKIIKTNGITLDCPVTISGVGGTFQLFADTTIGGGTARTLTLSGGTLDVNGKILTNFGNLSSTGSSVRQLKLASGTYNNTNTATATIFTASGSNFSTDQTGTIKISGATTNVRTFAGGGFTYGNIWFSNATPSGQLNITGANTFADLKCDTPPQTILFTAATTTTVSTWSVNGTAGNLITIGSITASSHTLTKSGGGTVLANYLSVSRSTATPSSTWYAGHSTDGGNNSGWTFTIPVFADAASFTYSAQTATPTAARLLTAVNTSFILSGQSISTMIGLLFTAAEATFTLSGQTASLLAARILTAADTAYTFTGQTASMLAGRLITAAYNAFTITADAASLLATRILSALDVAYTFTGNAILFGRSIVADVALFTLTGIPISYRLNGLRTLYTSKFTPRSTSHDSKFTTRSTSHSNKFE